jgi:acyl-CoA thioester hydrolase
MKSDFRFFHTLRVRYSEIDGQGIVFNAHYMTYADVGIVEYFRFLGLDIVELARDGVMDIALVKSTLNFKASAGFDDLLEIGVRVSRLGNSSFTVDFEMFKPSRDEPIVGVQSVYVNYNEATRSSAPLPDVFVSAVKKAEGMDNATPPVEDA